LVKSCHGRRMEHIKNLRSVYSFPGCEAQATVKSYGEDPDAIVVNLRRRRKKRSARAAEPRFGRITTRGRGTYVTSRAETGECFCCCGNAG
jgi:hypothetical protein